MCKNVLIYFGDAAARSVANDLLGALSDDGLLVVARSEVPLLREIARPVVLAAGVTVFRRRQRGES